jgi:arylsulfatase A-like enzyme
VREVALVDKALGNLIQALGAAEFSERCVLIVSADHGEFFGEHGYYYHGQTLYDEVVRVPLIINAPGLTHKRITEPVSLLDLGPTILEIFGVSAASDAASETLWPLIAGSGTRQRRPIPLQSRVSYGLVFPDGYKVTVNWRRHWEEVYDLHADPEERSNLRDRDRRLGDERISLLRQYFNNHAKRRPDGQPF